MSEEQENRAMPMKLAEQIIAKLNEIVADAKCEMCGHPDFGLNPLLATPTFLHLDEESNKVTLDLRNSHPCAVTHCEKCGNTKFFSLLTLGLKSGRDEAES